jgi:hypothetical protein
MDVLVLDYVLDVDIKYYRIRKETGLVWKTNIRTLYLSIKEMNMNLGIIKVILNPFLRLFGYQIGTIYSKSRNELLWPIVCKCEKRNLKFSFDFKLDSGETLDRIRTII